MTTALAISDEAIFNDVIVDANSESVLAYTVETQREGTRVYYEAAAGTILGWLNE